MVLPVLWRLKLLDWLIHLTLCINILLRLLDLIVHWLRVDRCCLIRLLLWNRILILIGLNRGSLLNLLNLRLLLLTVTRDRRRLLLSLLLSLRWLIQTLLILLSLIKIDLLSGRSELALNSVSLIITLPLKLLKTFKLGILQQGWLHLARLD